KFHLLNRDFASDELHSCPAPWHASRGRQASSDDNREIRRGGGLSIGAIFIGSKIRIRRNWQATVAFNISGNDAGKIDAGVDRSAAGDQVVVCSGLVYIKGI